MADQKWLPAGWTVEEKVRKNGKKDKCYIAPSNGLKFYSKAEVSRYLNTIRIIRPKSPKSKQNRNGNRKRPAKNVVVEKVIAEGLPPGWIKEIRVKKKDRTIRRDPYYTDPVSGYVFRSMKDVLRYLKTGELGRLAFKPKDSGSSDAELEDDKISSPAVPERQKLGGRRTKRQINEMVKDERILESACLGECIPLSEHTYDQCGKGTELSSLILPVTKDSEQIEGNSDCAKGECFSVSAVGAHPEMQPLENGVERRGKRKTQPGLCESKDKKSPILPRRVSKRIAGLEVDPTPELKTTDRARRVAAGQSGKAEASTAEGFGPGSWAHCASQRLEAEPEAKCTFHASASQEVLLESTNTKNPFGYSATPEEHAGKVETENKVTPKEHAGKVETENKADEKVQCPIVLPLGNLEIKEEHAEKVATEGFGPGSWAHCASQRLEAEPEAKCTFHTSTSKEVLLESTNSKNPFGDLATPEEHAGKVETKNEADEKGGCSIVLPLGNLETKGDPAEMVETENKANEKPGFPLDLPFGDSWTDPCIEFAIKTLTGAIPVGDDLDIQDYFQQQPSSSQIQGDIGMTLPNVGLDNFCQTDLLFQPFDTVENPGFKQQALVKPALPHTENVSLPNSGQTGLHRPDEERRKECPR